MTRMGEWNRVATGYTRGMATRSPLQFRTCAIGEVITPCAGTAMESVKTTDGIGYRKCAGCDDCARRELPPVAIAPTAPARAMERMRLMGGLAPDDDPM